MFDGLAHLWIHGGVDLALIRLVDQLVPHVSLLKRQADRVGSEGVAHSGWEIVVTSVVRSQGRIST